MIFGNVEIFLFLTPAVMSFCLLVKSSHYWFQMEFKCSQERQHQETSLIYPYGASTHFEKEVLHKEEEFISYQESRTPKH